jgi:hypothetical protein
VNYFADFDRYVIVERNEVTKREVQSLRFERRLRGNAEPRSGARLAAFVSKSMRPLLRGSGLAS